MKIFITENQLGAIKEAFSQEYLDFKKLFNSAPKELKDRFFKGWDIKQRADFHPEGNTLKHMMEVTKRAIKTYPNDIDMILAAFFHDIGKDAVYAINPKTGNPSAFGHEKVSADLVEKYASWIKGMGGDVQRIKEIVASHMKIKNLPKMTDKKAKELEQNPYFADFIKFKFIDKGGLKMMDVPSDIKVLARKFGKYGNGLYLVGGAVRDMFLGKTPKDYDLTTDASPDRIKSILQAGWMGPHIVAVPFGPPDRPCGPTGPPISWPLPSQQDFWLRQSRCSSTRLRNPIPSPRQRPTPCQHPHQPIQAPSRLRQSSGW